MANTRLFVSLAVVKPRLASIALCCRARLSGASRPSARAHCCSLQYPAPSRWYPVVDRMVRLRRDVAAFGCRSSPALGVGAVYPVSIARWKRDIAFSAIWGRKARLLTARLCCCRPAAASPGFLPLLAVWHTPCMRSR